MADVKVGVGDVLIGATALAADYNGAAKASHVKDKLIEMTHLNETLFSCGVACSCEGCKTKSGNYIIDLLLAMSQTEYYQIPFMRSYVLRKISQAD